jgi:hypothetical protein
MEEGLPPAERATWLTSARVLKLLVVGLALAALACALPFESFLGGVSFALALELCGLAIVTGLSFAATSLTNWWGAREAEPGETVRRSHLLRRSYAYALEPERVQLDVFPSPLGNTWVLLGGITLLFGTLVVAAAQDALSALQSSGEIYSDAISAAVVLGAIWLVLATVIVVTVPRRIRLALERQGPLWLRVERVLGAPRVTEFERDHALTLCESRESGTWSLVLGSAQEGISAVLLSGALPVDQEIASDIYRLQKSLATLASPGVGSDA